MIHHTEQALEWALLCEQFTRLTKVEGHSGNVAARMLEKSPSFFSGANSTLARYWRAGMEAFAPRQSKIRNSKSQIP